MKKPVYLKELTLENDGDTTEVSAVIDGERLWFRSNDHSLIASPEGFIAAVLFPAMQHDRPIYLDESVDAVWLENIEALKEIQRGWWKLPGGRIESPASARDTVATKGTQSALCFSCGVDSFFSLLNHKDDYDIIVFVAGYDAHLGDIERIRCIERCIKTIGDATGKKAVIISTNLREHSIYQGIHWERSHGGALAAIGYLMDDVMGLGISASYPYSYRTPWGSHYETDPLWSSSHLTVSHIGVKTWRADKLIAIKDDPLVQQNLRVCWENGSSDLNCCKCEKCIRTMLILKSCNTLQLYKVFPLRDQLQDSIHQLKILHSRSFPVYERFSNDAGLLELKMDLDALLSRSKGMQWWLRLVHSGAWLARRILPKILFNKIRVVLYGS